MIPQDPPLDNTPPKRKPISPRLRFEILRRDDNTCRYCGGKAPDVKLTIDHVTPTVLGGTDDPGNLVAACKDCNSGKSSSSPDAALVAQVSDDAVRWAEAMKLAAERLNANKAAVAAELKPWFDEWFVWSGPGWSYKLPDDADDVLTKYLAAGMPISALVEAARVACRARQIDRRFRYFQGVANNMLAELQKDAAAILSDPAASTTETPEQVAYWNGYVAAMLETESKWARLSFRGLSRVVDGPDSWNAPLQVDA